MGVVSSNGHVSEAAIESDAILRDIDFLSAQLPHRGGVTENERRAAEYISRRFSEHAPLAQIEDFYSIDAYPYLFSMYYAEFFFVALIGMFWPWIALAYGLAVFLTYMAEFTGYSTMSRFLPQFETQNVTARIPCARAERVLVVTAHYDTPKAYAWTQGRRAGRTRGIHIALVAAMVLVLASCGAQGFGIFDGFLIRPDLVARAAAVGLLLAGAWGLFTGARNAPFTPGANNNASGVAALLAIARRLTARPLASSDVLLVATGAKESWLSGMRQLFRSVRDDARPVLFVNMAGVGAGALRYVTAEGMLHVYSAGPQLVDAARVAAPEYGARPLIWRNLPTDALIPMARGFEAISVVGVDEDELPAAWNSEGDTADRIEARALVRAIDFVEELLRRVDSARATA